MRMMRSRRGEEADAGYGTVAVIVLILVGAIIVWLLMGGVTKAVTSQVSGHELCKKSVLAQALAISAPKAGELVSIQCQTSNLKFYEDGVELNGKKMEVYDPNTGKYDASFSKLNDTIVNSVVAEELRLCWDQFLEGKRSIWSSSLFFPGDGDQCFLCGEINFDINVKMQRFAGFYDYTRKTLMPRSDKTYYAYYAEEPRLHTFLYNSPDKNTWEQFAAGKFGGITLTCSELRAGILNRPAIETDIQFEKSKMYVVVFIREGQARALDTSADPSDPCSRETYFAYVIPSDQIPKVCDSVKRGGVS